MVLRLPPSVTLALVAAFALAAGTTHDAMVRQRSSAAVAASCNQINPPPPPSCYSATVVRAGSNPTTTRMPNTGGYGETFTVQNTGHADDYTITCGGTGPVTCTGTSASVISGLSPMNVVAYYSVGAPGNGTLSLTVTGTYKQASASYSVPVWAYLVAVTPDSVTTAPRSAHTSGYSESFTVRNQGPNTDTYAISCAGSTNVTCTGTSVTTINNLTSGTFQNVTAQYTVGTTGTGLLKLIAASANARDSGSYLVNVVPASVAVTPDSGVDRRLGQQSYVDTFVVRNPGAGTTSYDITAACSGAAIASGCTWSPSSVTLASNASSSVSVPYTTGTAGNTGRITVRATQTGDPTVFDTGWSSVTVVTAQRPLVDLVSVNAGTTRERELCLTIAAAAAAAAECGDLRIVHALPSVRTLNKLRTPTLIYNSAEARPYPLVAANVSLPTTAANPDSVYATLKTGIVIRGTAKWAGADWKVGSASRIVVADTTNPDTTGIYTYTLIVTNWWNGTSALADTQTVQVPVVARQKSPFGAGWWLAGLERLYPASMLWVGGDGSTRQYVFAGANVWAAPNVDRPDTLKKDPVLKLYTRFVPHGVRVVFDTLGRHIFSINRLNDTTKFTWGGGDTLLSIKLPPTGLAYQFSYTNGSRWLVSSPLAPSQTRADTGMISAGRLMAVRGPDTSRVSFGYFSGQDSNVVSSRTDRRGFATTYTFDAGKRLTQSSLNMGAGQAAIVRQWRPLETLGYPPTGALHAPDTGLAYARYDGPRTEVGDTTLFWLNALGAPRRIRDALGDTTLLTRGDARWPGLVTRTAYPNGQVMGAVYDDHGNVTTVTDSSTIQGGRYATTRFVWNRKWDFDSIVVPPEGDSLVMSYSDANGNRLSQTDAEGNTTYFHYGDTHGFGLMTGVRTPLATAPVSDPIRDSLTYDALGNLFEEVTPLGFHTTYYRDAVGRDTLITSPIDRGGSSVLGRRHVYDVMDLETLTQTLGPTRVLSATIPGETLTVLTVHDPEGNVTQVQRQSTPDSNAIGWITTQWHYDPAGRSVKEIAPDGFADSTVYDPAGNTLQAITRRGHVITAQFDPLNRLSRRIRPTVSYPEWSPNPSWSFPLYSNGLTIASDTATFTYDAVGNTLAADNGDAQVRRSYNPNGTLAADTLRIRTVAPVSAGGNYTTHAYVLRYGYDLDGRRRWLKHPRQLAPIRSNVVYDSTAYAYTPRGLLGSVTDVFGNAFGFNYDAEGRLHSLTEPGRVSEIDSYDAQGQLQVRVEQDSSFVGTDSGFTTPTFRHDSLAYDARGKLDTAVAINWTAFYEYSPLGTVVRSYNSNNSTGSFTYETFNPDAFGNTHLYTQWLSSQDTRRFYYQPGIGRHRSTRNSYVLADTMVYDSAGNVHVTGRNEVASSYVWYQVPVFYYAADQQLRVVDRRSCVLDGNNTCISSIHTEPMRIQGVFEEYRYDALGRRIWVRSRADSTCANSNCLSAIQRTVWDGDQILYEMRYPGGDTVSSTTLERDTGLVVTPTVAAWGRVGYTHGAGLDDPLSVIRIGYTGLWPLFVMVPHRTWRGEYEEGTFERGQTRECTNYSDSSTCVLYDWPALQEGVYYNSTNNTYFPPISWMGSLLDSKRDLSTNLYERNRYVDPVTGRFTQEDPIGLAGGRNLYGFAGGDPVNNSDPFGLQDCNPPGSCAALWVAGGIAIGATGGAVLDAGCAAATAGICVLGAPALVSGGGALGGAVGGMAGELEEHATMLAASLKELGKEIHRKVDKAITYIGLIVRLLHHDLPPKKPDPDKHKPPPTSTKTALPRDREKEQPQQPE